MVQEVTNFSQFYASFGRLPYDGNREEFKKNIVMQYTGNRTGNLSEMTRKEYSACCGALEKIAGQDERWRKMREQLRYRCSVCLKLRGRKLNCVSKEKE